MPRVIGIDPGTVSIDLCGLDEGRVFLDRSLPTAEALASPDEFVATLEAEGPVDLVAGPSGYGLPLVPARDATDEDLRLAFLAPQGEPGGIGGLRALARAFARSSLPVVFTPGVIHLPSVPAHRKVNRIDMGTADKVCAAVLAVREQAARLASTERDVSCIVVELGGAFTAALAVEGGRIVDGAGGSAGALGLRAAGALDGEVAFLAGAIEKSLLFTGGASAIAGERNVTGEALATATSARGRVAWEALLDSVAKAVAALAMSAPSARDVIVSGRLAPVAGEPLERRLVRAFPQMRVHRLAGFARVAKHAAQGAALMADGLAGGASRGIVEALGIGDAGGTVLDHLYVISRERARARLGLP